MPNISNKRDDEHDEMVRIHLTASSRYRRRADGGTDTIYRLNFRGAPKRTEMRRITETLLQAVDDGADYGITALTKVEFLEPDTCDVRYWVVGRHSDVVNVFLGLWYRLAMIHPLSDVDGARYDFLRGRENRERPDER